MKNPFNKGGHIWMMISNHIHVWLGKGMLNYWNFILNRILVHYQINNTHYTYSVSEKKVIVMVDGYPGGQGGLTDRLQGALSVYSLCKERHWDFYFYFIYPFRLEEYLEPNKYNWSIESKSVSRCIPFAKPIVLFIMNVIGETWLVRHLLIKNISSDKHAQYHIYTSVIFNKQQYAKLFKELFKPSPILESELLKEKSHLNSRYISVSFRFQELLGDLKEANECITLSSNEQICLIDKCIEHLKDFIQTIPKEYRILITADSSKFLNEAKKLPRVYVSPGKVYHPHYAAQGNHPFLKSFIDLFMLMDAEKVYLFKTGLMYKSGFPKFAALLGGKKFVYHEF